jgi:hypothetical protein
MNAIGCRLGALTAALTLAGGPAAARGIGVTHLYELSDFAGTVPYSDVLLHVDRGWDEVYATDGGTVRIFNAAGMEVYQFRKDWSPGTIFGLGVDEDGDILLLLRDYTTSQSEPSWSLQRCDYRGEPIGPIEVRGLPAAFASFSPDRMVYDDGAIYLVSSSALQVVLLDEDGGFRRGHDLARLLGIEQPEIHDIFGFSLDRDGNMLFTLPVLFKAFLVSPDESVRQFGTPGSSAGKFGVVSGIVADDQGNYLVADKLRHVVMVFDPSFELITEIGFEAGRQSLVRPTTLAIGNAGRLYVTQARDRGVSVYSLTNVTGGPEGDPVQEGNAGDPADASRRGRVADPAAAAARDAQSGIHDGAQSTALSRKEEDR